MILINGWWRIEDSLVEQVPNENYLCNMWYNIEKCLYFWFIDWLAVEDIKQWIYELNKGKTLSLFQSYSIQICDVSIIDIYQKTVYPIFFQYKSFIHNWLMFYNKINVKILQRECERFKVFDKAFKWWYSGGVEKYN